MKRPLIITLIVLALVAAGLLIWSLTAGKPAPATPNNNVVAPPPLTVTPPAVVPTTLSDQDRQGATKMATLFVESFASYDPSIEEENINISTLYSTARLQEELIAFEPTYLAQRAEAKLVSSITTVDQVTVEAEPATAEHAARVVAHVSATTRNSSGGAGFEVKSSGEVYLITLNGLWYVDDLAFNPKLLGFK